MGCNYSKKLSVNDEIKEIENNLASYNYNYNYNYNDIEKILVTRTIYKKKPKNTFLLFKYF